MNGAKNEIIRTLLSISGALFLVYIGWAKDLVTEAELDNAIKHHTPYMQDREWLTKQASNTALSAQKMEVAIGNLSETVNALRVEVAKLSTRIEMSQKKEGTTP